MTNIQKAKEKLSNNKQWRWWLAFGLQFVLNIVVVAFWLGGLTAKITQLETGRQNNQQGIKDINTKLEEHLNYHIELNGVVQGIGENVKLAKDGIKTLSDKYDKYLFESAKHKNNE